MRKLLIVLGIFFGFAFIGYLLVKNYYHIDEKALLTAIKPPAEDISEKLPQGSDLETPLKIPNGTRLAVFTDLKELGMPRVLAFDKNRTLFASITRNGKVIALPDEDKDGIADRVIELISNLDRPHGIAFENEKIFIAETDKVVAYDYDSENFTIGSSQELFSLPGGGRHFTRTIKIYDGKLYTSVGSSCDVCVEDDEKRSTILVSDLNGKNLKVFAKGLRNTVFFDFDKDGRIWGNDMGRDFLGDLLPPDEVNMISEGKDYGWPYCYGKNLRDLKFSPGNNLDYCLNTQPSAYDYPAHIAPLGITFINSQLFSRQEQGDILSAFHGSWNSSVPVGYKIVKLTVAGGRVTKMEDFITGWLKDNDDVLGRPVDLAFDKDGVLYISDDKAGLIYILTRE